MSFLYPGFLYGLFAIAIPVIIHLFNFRRYKKIYFTNVSFLKEVKQESESKSKLKHLLILIARILAVICLVLAFAQPFIPTDNKVIKKGNKAISIYIDNSFSMETINKHGFLLENAKHKAKEIANIYKPTDRFQLLTNDFEGRHQRLLSREEFIEALNEVKISPTFRALSEVYHRQNDLLASSGANDKKMFVISDFQQSNVDLANIKTDTSVSTVFIPLVSNNTDNVFIDTCWFETPVQQTNINQKLHVKIVNNSEKNIENASLKLFINEKQIAPASYSIEAQSKTEIVVSFLLKQNGIQNCRLEIEDHPVTFDDKLFFSFSVNNSIPALVIQGEQSKATAYMRSLMQHDSLFKYTEMSEKAVDYSQFQKNNLIVLNELTTITSGMEQELKKFTEKGGSILLFPSPKADLESYNMFFTFLKANTFLPEDSVDTKADKINFAQGLYSGVFEKENETMDLPKVFSHYPCNPVSHSNEEIIVKLLNGHPFLSLYSFSKGKLYVCTSPLEDNYSNFARHALFVPTIIKIAINSQRVTPLYYSVGRNEAIEVNPVWGSNKEEPLHIISVDNKHDFIPETRVTENAAMLYTQNQTREAGNYFLNENKQNLSGLSFNFLRKESDLKCFTTDELKKLIEDKQLKTFSLIEPSEKSLSSGMAELSEGKKLWKFFVILTLTFLAIEILLIRILK